MKLGDVFTNDSEEHSSESDQSDNESNNHDGDDEDESEKSEVSDEESKNESDDDEQADEDKDDNDDEPKEWIEYGSLNEPSNEESIWMKIREEAVQDLENKFEEVDKISKLKGFLGKKQNLEHIEKR